MTATDVPERPKKNPLRFLSKKQVLDRVPLSFPTLWKMMQRDEFPRSRLASGKTVWLESEIDAWILSRPRCEYKADREKIAKISK
jgi:predicted DNA-binding transcriptional regulator AlpA